MENKWSLLVEKLMLHFRKQVEKMIKDEFIITMIVRPHLVIYQIKCVLKTKMKNLSETGLLV